MIANTVLLASRSETKDLIKLRMSNARDRKESAPLVVSVYPLRLAVNTVDRLWTSDGTDCRTSGFFLSTEQLPLKKLLHFDSHCLLSLPHFFL